MKSAPSSLQLEADIVCCEHCDALHRRVALRTHDVARCIACGAVLERHSALGADELLAITIAALVVFLITSLNPLLAVGFGGMQAEATVWGAAVAMLQGWMAWAGLVLAVTTFLVPLVQLALLLWLLSFATLGRSAPGAVRLVRALQALRPWGMTEVFLLGALVALIKLSGWVPVQPGVGIWALAALCALLAVLNSVEPKRWWTLCLPR